MSYLENLECPRQSRRLGAPQSEEDVEERFSIFLLEHYLLAGLCSLRRRGRGFPLLARVLNQTLASPDESLRLSRKEKPEPCRF